MRRLFSILFWTFFAVSSLVYFLCACVIWIVTLPFDRQRRLNHLWSCLWASSYVYAYPGWNVRVTGRDNIDPKRAYVLVANHTSIADIVLLFTLFKQFKWVSKTAVFKYPLLGWNMTLSRYVPLQRGDKSSIDRMMAICRTWLKSGMSVMMFPEGTRSKDGQLQPFKHGAFTLAKDTGVPVVPICVHGGHGVIAKHEGIVAPRADLWVEILPPIESAELDLEALSNASRLSILNAQARQPGEALAPSAAHQPTAPDPARP